MAEKQPSSLVQPSQSRKRQLRQPPNWDKCLCHVQDESGTLTNFSEKSWLRFQACAKRRNDVIWAKMKVFWEEGPKGKYHRRCYQVYTDKVKVARAVEKQRHILIEDPLEDNDSDDSITEPPPAKRVSRSQIDAFDINKCAICQQYKTMLTKNKGARSREPLSLNMTATGSASLLKAAQIQDDRRLLLKIQGQDTIAIEIKYHKSCYVQYVRPGALAKLEEKNCEDEDIASESYNGVFDNIREYVNDTVLKEGKAVKMSELLEHYVDKLSQEGVNAPSYRSSKLKNRFGNKLSYHQPLDRSQSEIVYSSHVTTGEVVETVLNTSGNQWADEDGIEEVTPEAKEDEKYLHVYHTAKMIRSLVTEMKPVMTWPPTEDDLDCSNTLIPDLLYNMFAWICSSDVEYSNKRVCGVSVEVRRLALSLAQDLIHCVSRGRIKTPKHVILPLTVKSLTGNAELVTILNRFGHALSYSHIEELETALAEKEIVKEHDGIIVPSTCSMGVPAVFCWDNNDLLEETLPGTLKRFVYDLRQSSFSAENASLNIQLTSFSCIPLYYRYLSTMYTLNYILFVFVDCTIIDSFLFLGKGTTHCTNGIVIPAWTGFNIKLQQENVPRESSIGYCQVIDASPTEIPTVYTLLQKSLQIADQLGQQNVTVVFDQAIYAKALEVIWQNQETFQRLVVRMGSFHTICSFLAAIGKRFGDAGLGDIVTESRIVGSGSVAAVLEGRHYNRALRTHKVSCLEVRDYSKRRRALLSKSR